MNYQQISELEHALHVLEGRTDLAALDDAADCVSSSIWKMRIRAPRATNYRSIGPHVSLANSRLWDLAHALLKDGHDGYSIIDGGRKSVGLTTDFVYDAGLLDRYALALETDLLRWELWEIDQVYHVEWMLQTWLKNERDLNPAPLPKLKKLRTPTSKKLTHKMPKTAWEGARKFAIKQNSLWSGREHQKKFEPSRCVTVYDDGCFAVREYTLVFVKGETDKEPGVYNAKTGKLSVTEQARWRAKGEYYPGPLNQWYTDIFCAVREGYMLPQEFETDELLDACVFVSSMGDYAQWNQTPEGLVLRSLNSERGEVQVELNTANYPPSSRIFPVKEVIDALKLMGDRVAVRLYLDGSILFFDNRTLALTIPIDYLTLMEK